MEKMKKTGKRFSPEGDNLASIFPLRLSPGGEEKGELLLKNLLCLPGEFISLDFLRSILPEKYPLDEITEALAARSLIVLDREKNVCLLPPASRAALSDLKPVLQDVISMVGYIAKNMVSAGFENIRDWTRLGKTVITSLEDKNNPVLADFSNAMIKVLCMAGFMEEARELLAPGVSLPNQTGEFENLQILAPYINACDALILSKEGGIVGLRYDEENMYVPIVVFMDRGLMAVAAAAAAEASGTPVLENTRLANELLSRGRIGQAIPEYCYRETAAVLSRAMPGRPLGPSFRKRRSVSAARPLILEAGGSLWALLREESYGIFLKKELSRIRKRLSRLLGYSLPAIALTYSRALGPDEYRVLLKGVEAGRKHVRISSPNWAGEIISQVDEIALRRAADFLGRDELNALLDKSEETYPVVTGEARALLSLGSIREILRGLLSEQVSIRHLQVILETLADFGNYGPVPNEVIIEQIRQSLKSQICTDYADEKQVIRALTVNGLDKAVDAGTMAPDEFSYSRVADTWYKVISPAVEKMARKRLKPVIVCNPALRPWLRKLLRDKYPAAAVLSFSEIPKDFVVQPVDDIKLKDWRP